jgi:hypothetical protein
MVSDETAAGLGSVFALRLLMPIQVVGKEQPVKVYEVMGLGRQLEHDDIECLTRNEAAEDDMQSSHSDRSSMHSDKSSMQMQPTQAGLKMRRSHATTVQMIRDATVRSAQEVPLVINNDTHLHCTQHTAAVHLYMRKDFAGAIEKLASVHKMVPAEALEASGKSIDMLRNLCEKYLQEGCPDDFNGVYRALEK